MDSSLSRAFDLKTALVSAICVVGAAYSSYLLFLDLNSTGGRGVGKPLARLEFRENKVKRKTASSFVWTNVQDQEVLYRKDTVQTGNASSAKIRMNDGTVLEVGENSLVVIDDTKSLALNFLKGTVILHDAIGDRKISSDGKGVTKIEEFAFRLVKPESLKRFYVLEKAVRPIKFSWQPRPGSDAQVSSQELKLEISPSKTFQAGSTQVIKINASTSEFNSNLSPGRYYWKLSNNERALTEISRFEVISLSPLVPVWPNSSQKILIWGDDGQIQFRWAVPSTSKPDAYDESAHSEIDHWIELATESDFKNVILKESISALSASATLRAVPFGTSYWRIRSQFGDLEILSTPEKLIAEQTPKLSLQLDNPDPDVQLALPSQLRFNWTADSKEVEFQIEVQNKAGKQVISNKSQTTAFAWKNPPDGTYRWRVVAFWKTQNVGETAWRDFSIYKGSPITLSLPDKDQDIRYWTEPVPVQFQWTHDPLLDQENYSYVIEAGLDPDFKKPLLSEKIRDAKFSGKFSISTEAIFFWRVRLINEEGQSIKSSETSRFKYGVYPLLPAPVGVQPENAKVYNALEEDVTPIAAWTEVKNAQAYQVTLWADTVPGRNPASLKMILQTIVDKPMVKFKSLGANRYYWSVQPIDPLKRFGKAMPTRSFTITYGDVLDAPLSLTPEVQ